MADDEATYGNVIYINSQGIGGEKMFGGIRNRGIMVHDNQHMDGVNNGYQSIQTYATGRLDAFTV